MTGSLLETALRPTRRGDLRAVGVDRAPVGPARPGRAAAHPRRRGRAAVAAAVRVAQAPALAALQRLRELDGRAAVRIRGQGTEFDSLREYVRGDDVRSHRLAGQRAQPQRRGPHLAARARPPRGAGARHLAYVGRAGRRRTPPRLGDGRRPAARRARRPGRRPGRLRRRRPPGPHPPAVGRAPATWRRPLQDAMAGLAARDRRGRLDRPGRRGQRARAGSAPSSSC